MEQKTGNIAMEAIAPAGILGIAQQAREWFVERLTRLYEQGESIERIGYYVRRWRCWAVTGLGDYGHSISGFIPGAYGAIG